MPSFRYFNGSSPVPRLLLIFSPLFTVKKPWTNTLSGVLRPLNFNIAGQNKV